MALKPQCGKLSDDYKSPFVIIRTFPCRRFQSGLLVWCLMGKHIWLNFLPCRFHNEETFQNHFECRRSQSGFNHLLAAQMSPSQSQRCRVPTPSGSRLLEARALCWGIARCCGRSNKTWVSRSYKVDLHCKHRVIASWETDDPCVMIPSLASYSIDGWLTWAVSISLVCVEHELLWSALPSLGHRVIIAC